MNEYGKSSTGFDENVVAAISYFPVLGLVALLIEKRSHFVRFHAVQSTLGYAILAVLWLAVKWIGALAFLSWAPDILALVFCVYMMLKAYDGEEYKLPLIGNLAFGAVYETQESEDLLAVPEAESDETTEGI